MMSIATAACAFCVAQTANAAETSATTGVNATVNSSANNSSNASSNTATSSVVATSSTADSPSVTSSSVTSSTATSNTTNGGGSAFAKGSANEVKTAEPKDTAEPKNTVESKNTAEQGKAADSAKPSEPKKTADSATTVQSTAIYAATSGSASSQSQTGTQQTTQVTSSTNNGSTANDDSSTWTREDFNISADGKIIGLTGLNKTDGYPGLNAKGVAKLKKNPHVVIPDGVEVILKDAFLGKLDQPGNKYKTNESYIEGVTLPKSLKIIEYGAFAWNKIKGTVVIPKSVVSIHAGAFISNQIERVVFEGIIDGKGKLKESDSEPYYVAGIGSRAFQGNRITDIVVPGNFADMKLRFDNTNPNDPDPGPFDNQEYDTTTIEVGEAFTSPLTIHQAGNKQEKISGMGGFMENRIPTLIAYSSYFDFKNGSYVAKKTGTIQGQWMLYDVRNGINSPIGTLHFTYDILPKGSLCTVTFNNEHTVIAKVRVKKGQTITNGVVNNGQMPANPTKASFTFMGWNTAADGSGTAFSADTTVVTKDLDVYAYFKNFEPELVVKSASITEGDSLDLNSLVVSATDKEDGDLKSSVQLTDNGGFDNTKVGSYNITFSVKDKGGATATAAATVTVTKKPTPPTPPAPTPEPEPDIDWDDIPDIDLTPDKEPEPVPVIVAPAPILPPAEAEPEPAPAPSQPKQPEQQAKHVAKRLPKTGSTATPILASAIASLFAGLAGLAESFAATRKRRN